MLVTCAGIHIADLVAADLPKISDPGEVVFAPEGIKLSTGGHASNVSIDLIKLGLPRGGVSSVGCVGKDIFGDFMENELKRYGVVTHLARTDEAETSKTMVLVVRGEDRRFHIDVGADYLFDPNNVQEILSKEKPSIFYVGGTGQLGKFDEKLAHVLQGAKKLGCINVVDPIAPYKHGWDTLSSGLRWIDVLHCNDTEASEITGGGDPENAIRSLVKEGVKIAVISKGELGLAARTEKVRIEMPAFKTPTVDPTGAGDALCAGMIYKLVQLMEHKTTGISEMKTGDITSILLEGEAAGAACVKGIGTTTAVSRENADKLLREQGSSILERTVISHQR